jgi:hypothetical protein
MRKQRRLNQIVCAAFSLLAVGCAEASYHAAADGEAGESLASSQRWEVRLPYESGRELSILNVSADEVLLSEGGDDFHLVRIQLDGAGRPASRKHQRLPHGDSCELLEGGLILVKGKQDAVTARVSVFEREGLSLRFSLALPVAAAADITTPASTQLGDVLILSQSAVKIDRLARSDSAHRYQLPYIAWSKYDLHLIDLTSGKVTSLPRLESHSLPGLNALVAEGKERLAADQPLARSLRSRQNEADAYVYLLDRFFLVDGGKQLIFSLSNLGGEKLYYSVNLTGGRLAPQLRTAAELASAYPDELVAKSRTQIEGERRVYISGKAYRVRRTAFTRGGIVLLASEVLDIPAASESGREVVGRNVIVGVRPKGGPDDLSFEQSWVYVPKYRGDIGSFVVDDEGGAVYFPELLGKGWLTDSFKVQGLSAADGRLLEGFPANFKETRETNDRGKELSLVGASPDFRNRRLYVHDYENHRLVCAGLPER